MAGLFGRRIGALAGVLFAAMATLVITPASAQAGIGAQATPLVGVSGTANCPPGTAADQVVLLSGTSGDFTVGFPAGGSCQDGGAPSANTQGQYTFDGSAPLPFSSSCQAAGLQHGGGVFVPEGTIVNPGPGQTVVGPGGTTITAANTPVILPGGPAATLNVVELTGTTVTRTAIVSNGTQIGQVVCGQLTAYPLAVDTAAAAAPDVVPQPLSSGDSGGPANGLLLLGGALALLVLAQVAFGRKLWGRNGDATG